MAPSPFARLDRQIAVVTGSSSGIGREIAIELADAGADLFIHGGTDRPRAEEVADAIRGMGRKAIVIMADLADTRQHEALVDSCWNAAGGIDIWVNNAGADVLTGPASRMSFDEKLEQLWRVDVRGSIGISRRIGSRMKKRGRGVILNMGWDQAIWGMGGDSGELFSAIKGAVMSFSQSLARSLAPQVRVNCLAPGWIKTAWGQQASDDWQSRAQQECLLQRWGSVQDVARMARFLASPEAEFITAQIVPINGGFKHSC